MEKLVFDRKKLRTTALGHQARIARHMNKSKSTISKKMLGRYKISFDELNQICEALDMSPREFVSFERV